MSTWNDGKEVKDWGMYLYQRCIVIEDSSLGYEIEVKVLEVSPSKKRVKFRYPSRHEGWEVSSKWLIVEVLKEV